MTLSSMRGLHLWRKKRHQKVVSWPIWKCAALFGHFWSNDDDVVGEDPTIIITPEWPQPLLTMLTPKICNHILICANLCQPAKNLLIPPFHSWDTVNFRVHRPDWSHPFLTMPNQKYFDHLFVNLYQHAKNETVLWIYSGEIVDLKILQSGCLRAFWPISREHDFSQI